MKIGIIIIKFNVNFVKTRGIFLNILDLEYLIKKNAM